MKFVFDLDGTLSFDLKTIDPEIKEVLLSADKYGHELVFASARSYRDCIPLLGEELKNKLVIGLNGGVAYQNGQLLLEKRLNPESYRSLLNWCQSYNLPFFVDDIWNYSGQIIEKIPFLSSVDPLELADFKALSDLHHPIKLVLYMGDHEVLLADTLHYLEQFQDLEVSYHAHERCLYINPADTHKASTVVELCGPDFIAFGNDQNDIELFDRSLYAVQVGDFPALKAYADDAVSQQANFPAAVAAKILQVFADFRQV